MCDARSFGASGQFAGGSSAATAASSARAALSCMRIESPAATAELNGQASEKLAQQIELNMSVVTELEQAGEAVKISAMKRELVERESRVLRGCNEILDRPGE